MSKAKSSGAIVGTMFKDKKAGVGTSVNDAANAKRLTSNQAKHQVTHKAQFKVRK